MFCECFAVFPQNTQNTRKTSKNTVENTKNLAQHARVSVYCRSFPRAKKFDCIAQNTFHKTSAKHRKTPQNTAKQSQNAFCEITSQNTAKCTQNARKRHKTLTIQPQYVLHAFCVFLPKYARSVAKAYNTQYTRKLRRGGHVPAGGHVAGLWMFFKNSVLWSCFAVFCGVLRCFMCVFLAFFTKQHKTDQNVYKTHKTNKIRFVQYSAIRC